MTTLFQVSDILNFTVMSKVTLSVLKSFCNYAYHFQTVHNQTNISIKLHFKWQNSRKSWNTFIKTFRRIWRNLTSCTYISHVYCILHVQQHFKLLFQYLRRSISIRDGHADADRMPIQKMRRIYRGIFEICRIMRIDAHRKIYPHGNP